MKRILQQSINKLFRRTHAASNTLTVARGFSDGNVSEEEVRKFTSMANKWWDHRKNPLISMNPTRVEFMVEIIQNRMQHHGLIAAQGENASFGTDLASGLPFLNMKALDVGCGGGLLAESLSRLGADVTAIDPSVPIAHLAQEHSKASLDRRTASISYRGGTSVEDLANELVRRRNSASMGVSGTRRSSDDCSSSNDSLFDIVCILEVIEHVPDAQQLLSSAALLLKRPTERNPLGGTLFLSTLNRTFKSYMFAIIGAEYVSRILPAGTHDWNKFLSPEELDVMVRPLDLEPLDLRGIVMKPNLLCNMQWATDKNDLDLNWIGAYVHGTAAR